MRAHRYHRARSRASPRRAASRWHRRSRLHSRRGRRRSARYGVHRACRQAAAPAARRRRPGACRRRRSWAPGRAASCRRISGRQQAAFPRAVAGAGTKTSCLAPVLPSMMVIVVVLGGSRAGGAGGDPRTVLGGAVLSAFAAADACAGLGSLPGLRGDLRIAGTTAIGSPPNGSSATMVHSTKTPKNSANAPAMICGEIGMRRRAFSARGRAGRSDHPSTSSKAVMACRSSLMRGLRTKSAGSIAGESHGSVRMRSCPANQASAVYHGAASAPAAAGGGLASCGRRSGTAASPGQKLKPRSARTKKSGRLEAAPKSIAERLPP